MKLYKTLSFSLIILLSTFANGQKIARFIIVPDTQTYLESYPQGMENQFDWISKQNKNTDFVIQLGDLTQDNQELEWYFVRKNFEKLKCSNEDHKTPFETIQNFIFCMFRKK